jgi:hypothetical protein
MWDHQRKVHLHQNKSSRLTYGTFDCDSCSDNKYLCGSLGINRTPTVKFFGAGNFYQRSTSDNWTGVATYNGVYMALMFKELPNKRSVVMQDLYYWVPIMHGISQLQLRWLQLQAVVGLGKRHRSLPAHIKQLRGWIEARKSLTVEPTSDPPDELGGTTNSDADSAAIHSNGRDDADVHISSCSHDSLFGKGYLEVHGDGAVSDDTVSAGSSSHDASAKLGAKLSGDQPAAAAAAAEADAFAYLASMDYRSPAGSKALQCISNQADSFCNSSSSSSSDRLQSEPYCKLLQQCVDTGFAAAACRPPQCPFEAAIGCVMTAWCLQPAVAELAGF